LNEDGSLNAHVFNRENDISYIGEGIGYTQGLGLTYNVEFDTFKEMLRKIFNKKKLNESSNSSTDLPDSDLPPDFLNYINERKQKKSDMIRREIENVPEAD
jgi:hypothetical protein